MVQFWIKRARNRFFRSALECHAGDPSSEGPPPRSGPGILKSEPSWDGSRVLLPAWRINPVVWDTRSPSEREPRSKAPRIEIAQLGIMKEHDAEDDKQEHPDGE